MSGYEYDQEPVDEGLDNPDVVTKYKAAAKIVNGAMAAVIEACKPGVKVVDLCETGDSFINSGVSKEFKGKDIEKGIAVPTCVSVNNIVGHYSPLNGNTEEIKEGDMVKIDLGCHIDGYSAQAAHTIVVQSGPITGRAADVMQATSVCYEAAARLIKPGKKISDVAPVLAKIAEAYGCSHLEGVMSHQMKRFIIDGGKVVLNRPNPDQKIEDAEFAEGEVYSIDIIMSTGDGKPRVGDEKETTVFKRSLEHNYMLKLKASRELFAEINKKYPTMLFSLRGIEDGEAGRTRLGLADCLAHGLLNAFPVTYEKPGDLVAQMKGTFLLTPNGSDRITQATLQPVQSDKSVDDEEITALLATSLKKKKGKKAKKAAAAAQ
jgi:curved DNA binding protein